MNIKNNMDFISIFESMLAKYTGFKYAICADCCTNCILMALNAKCIVLGIDKNKCELTIPYNTYMSIPMTLYNYNWNFKFDIIKWKKFYNVGLNVFDAATDMHQYMVNDYKCYDNPMVCISFQQKKRLSLGRGGAILFNDKEYYKLLLRMRYDGRNPYLSDTDELVNKYKDIICGYHCYMEPDKAAKGILLLNLPLLLKPYRIHTWKEYTSLKNIENIFSK